MRLRTLAAVFLLLASLVGQAFPAPFVLFPKAGRLASPNGQFEVRDADRPGAATDFVGAFHSLWLIEISTGRSRKLCDYLGIAAVGWSGNDFLVVTQYVGKKTSRALVFSTSGPEEPVMLDESTLVQLVPVELRAALRENDHVFVEAAGLESETFHFRVWGYGQHDRNGFRWKCQYSLRDGKVVCEVAGETTFRR